MSILFNDGDYLDDTFDDAGWALYLINRDNPLPDDFTVNLSEIQGGYEADSRIAEDAKNMIDAAARDGIDLMVVSAYRDKERQQQNFDNYVRRLMEEDGLTYEEAYSETARQIALPGTSEHNAGLALDILSRDWWNENDDIDDTFDQTPEYEWLKNNSWKYGFILRYPEGSEDITGIIYEPWHYRYVGKYHAAKVFNSGLVLEEYIDAYNSIG